MASQDQITWLDLRRFGAVLALSEKNKYRERLSVLLIEDVQKAIALSNQKPDDFFAALKNNGFKIIPSEIPEHRNRMALSYHNPNGSSGLTPRNFQNVFLNMGHQDIKKISRAEIAPFTAPQQSHAQWHTLFLNNRTVYQRHDQEFFVVSCSPEHTLKQEYDDFIQNASSMYLRAYQIDSLPMDMLSEMGYKGNSLVKLYTSINAAYADGHDDSVIRKEKLSPFTQAVSVQENGTILAFEDLREVPEIFNHLPSEHPTWGDKALIFADAQFTLDTLNRSAQNVLGQNGNRVPGKQGIEDELEKLSQDLRDLNRIELTSPSFRESLKSYSSDESLYYLRKNKEDHQWYFLTRRNDGEFDKAPLNAENLLSLLQERSVLIDPYVRNLSDNHPLALSNNKYNFSDAPKFVRDFHSMYLEQEPKLDVVEESVATPPLEIDQPLEFKFNTSDQVIGVEPELPIIDQDAIDQMEPTSLEELIAKANLRPAAEMSAPQATSVLTGPSEAQVNEIIDGMFAQLSDEIEALENSALVKQGALEVDTDQPISVESIANSIDNNALAFIQEVGEEERKKTALAREQYVQNMQAALKGSFGTVSIDATLDEALQQIAPIENLGNDIELSESQASSDVTVIPVDNVTLADEHQDYVQFLQEEEIQSISPDVILPVSQDGTQLDTVTESGSDTLVFENPTELYSELELVIQEATIVPIKYIKDKNHQMLKQVQMAQSYRLYAKLYLLPEISKEITSLKELSVTLRNERDAFFEHELINNIGLSKELFPYTLPETRPLVEIQDELTKIQDQLSVSMDEQDAILNRISRIDTAFSRSLEVDRLVYSENENEDQAALDDRVTKAYQTLFSNNEYRQPEKLDTLVDNPTRTTMEAQYPSNNINFVTTSRLPRFKRQFGRRYQLSRFLKAKARFQKTVKKKTLAYEMPAIDILNSQIADHVKNFGSNDGIISDVSVMLKGLENLTGQNQFDLDIPSSNLVRMMREYAEQDIEKGASLRYMGGSKKSNVKDSYGFAPSEQALKDAKDKLAIWMAAKVEEGNPALKDSILFVDKSDSSAVTNHERNIGNQAALAGFFTTNFVAPKQPTIDGVNSVGWAMGRPGNVNQYKLVPYDLSSELDTEKYQPMKSRNYEVALEESYDHFRLNYVLSSLNIEADEAPKLERIAKLIRHSRVNDEAEFKALSKELWMVELGFNDFKDETFKIVEPETKEQIADASHVLTVGNTVIRDLSGDEVERLARTTVLAKILADAPVDRLNFDILPESSIATAYAKTLEPSREFKALREYFCPSKDDLSIQFINPTQYVNDMSERAVQAWNDLTTKLPGMLHHKNLDIILPTMQSNLDSPIYRLLPDILTRKALGGLGEELGLENTNYWKAHEATIYLTDFIDNFTAFKKMPISHNDALLLNVNGYVKALAKIGENRPYIENPPMYFPRLDNSQLGDQYKTKINFVPKLFDLIDKDPKFSTSIESLTQARTYNVKKIHADFLCNLDYDAIKRDAKLLNHEPLFGIDSRSNIFTEKQVVKEAQSVSELLDAQFNEPFVGVPMMLYKSRSFNANDLSHLRAVPSYVKIPSSTNYEPYGNKAVLPNHLIPRPDKPLDLDQHLQKLQSATATDIPFTPFNSTAASLIQDGLDNKHHPYYENFTIKADLQEIKIHEDMSQKMIVDRNSLKDYYRESMLYQAELLANAVEKIKGDKDHPKHKMPEDELNKAHVYLVNYDDNKFPMLVVDHKDTNRHTISSKGSVARIGTVDLANIENLALQADNITKSPSFTSIVENNLHAERMVINSSEIKLSPLTLQDLDPNTKELIKARIAGDLQNNIAWHYSNIINKQMSALGHALVMKPSTDTELARFKFVDVRKNDAHKIIEDGWKVLTSHGFDSKGKKYLEVGSSELLNMLLNSEDLLPKDLEATRVLLSENSKNTPNINDNRGYFGDVGIKLKGAHKDRFGYNFSLEDIRLMSSVEAQTLVTKSKIWSKPDFKEVAVRSGDIKFAILASAVYDMLPGKPKLIDGADRDIGKRTYSIAFYNDMVSGVRNATNESNSLTDFIGKLSQLSRDLNLTHAKTLGSSNLDALYTTKKNHLGYSVSSFLLDVPSYIPELYNELRPPNSISHPYHPVLNSAVKKATEKLLNPKGCKHEFLNVYAYCCHDFSEDHLKDKQINKEFALYIQTGELTSNLVEKLEYFEKSSIKENKTHIRTYDEVLADIPEATQDNLHKLSELPLPKASEPDNSLLRDGKTIAIVTPVDGREGVIQQEVKSSNWGMLASTRIGLDYRHSKNTDAFDLRNTFGMNAVEFGNSTPLYVRQEVTNLAFDAMRDLAKVLQIDESKISLGTGLAFASRGNKGAAAHYDPRNNIINLSGQNGAGSLAHEWFHSLDNYLAKLEKNYLLEKKFNLPTASVNATHYLTEMIANGYEPRTPISKMMSDILDSMQFKKPEQSKSATVNEVSSNQKLPFMLSTAKSDIQLQWFDKASKIEGTGPIFKVAGVEPKGNDLEEYLKWTLKKSESIADTYNSKVERFFAKDAKLCKNDSNLNGFKYASDQYSTFIEKSATQFGITSVTTFVKTQHPLYSERQRREVIDGLLKDIASQAIAEQMGGLHCKFMAVQSAIYMRDQLIKHAPDHLKGDDIVNDFVRSHSVSKLLELPKPAPEMVNSAVSATLNTVVEKTQSDFYSFAQLLDKSNGKGYWAAPCELFARTGEAFVNMKLEELNFKNTFLASGNSTLESPILPVGPELMEIAKKVDVLVEYVSQHILQSSKVYDAKNELTHVKTLDAKSDKEKKRDLEKEDGLTL